MLIPDSRMLFQQFRRRIENSAWVLLFLIFLFECCIACIWTLNGWIIEDAPLTYSLKYIVMPTSMNLIVLTLYHYTEYHTKLSTSSKNASLIMSLTFMCFSISLAHNALRIVPLSFILPLFLSAVFADLHLTKQTFFFNSLFYICCSIVNFFLAQPENRLFLILDIIAGALILIGSYLIAKCILQYEQKTRQRLLEYNEKQDILIEQLRRDPLTNLYNHNSFYKILEETMTRCEEDTCDVQLAMLDIDDFKHINDTYGHTRGDLVLVKLAELMQTHVKEHPNVFAARYGGEEFCLLYSEYSLKEAEACVNDMRTAFAAMSFPDLMQQHITFSAGVVSWRPGFDSTTALIDAADEALYEAKRMGKNRVIVH